ncbi:MAG: hypothetical protein IT367_20590 [Candidatus Hydrogenedentes bacterium]|nr:hypothetical protein [Candidatus Hydrogenedentota bacterium]
MKAIGKRALAVAGVAVLVYFVALPLFWPEPTVAADIPGEARMSETVPIRVSVHAWHRNVYIHQVRFYVDYTATTAKGPKGTFYPELIVEREPRRYVGFLARNPLTVPYAQYVDTQIDLSKFIDQGLIGPGELIGKLDVTFNYHPGRGGRSMIRDRTRTAIKSIPFQITVRE